MAPLIFAVVELLAVTTAAFAQQPPAPPPADNRFEYPQQYSVTPTGVNVQTGRFFYSKADLSIGTLSLIRHWGDQPSYNGVRSLGPAVKFAKLDANWNHTLNQGVSIDNTNNQNKQTVSVDGKRYVFKASLPTVGALGSTLVSVTDPAALGGLRWQFIDKDGSIFNFQGIATSAAGTHQVLTRKLYANGAQVDYFYNSDAQLTLVKDSRGYAIVFVYAASGNLQQACGYDLTAQYVTSSTGCASAPLRVSYGYDATGTYLTSVTDVLNGVTTIQYGVLSATAATPSCITLVNSATCEIQNFYSPTIRPGQVARQLLPTGEEWGYAYEYNPADPSDPSVIGQPRYETVLVTDGAGFQKSVLFDRGRILEVHSGGAITSFKYVNQVGTGNPPQTEYHDEVPRLYVDPDGIIEYFERDNKGNIITRSTWPSGVNLATITTVGGQLALSSDPDRAKCCVMYAANLAMPQGALTYRQEFPATYGDPASNKPTALIDPKGNRTDFEYSAVHGGILKETKPAVGGVRPQTRYYYTQRQPRVRNAAGSYEASGPQIWVLTSTSICKTGAPASSGVGCAIAGDEVITTYEYGPDQGPNHLLLRGTVQDSGGAGLRTCYSYDWQGNRISETRPKAGLTSCP